MDKLIDWFKYYYLGKIKFFFTKINTSPTTIETLTKRLNENVFIGACVYYLQTFISVFEQENTVILVTPILKILTNSKYDIKLKMIALLFLTKVLKKQIFQFGDRMKDGVQSIREMNMRMINKLYEFVDKYTRQVNDTMHTAANEIRGAANKMSTDREEAFELMKKSLKNIPNKTIREGLKDTINDLKNQKTYTGIKKTLNYVTEQIMTHPNLRKRKRSSSSLGGAPKRTKKVKSKMLKGKSKKHLKKAKKSKKTGKKVRFHPSSKKSKKTTRKRR